jgi:hypothetical protein
VGEEEREVIMHVLKARRKENLTTLGRTPETIAKG